jgi:hypothetical protein
VGFIGIAASCTCGFVAADPPPKAPAPQPDESLLEFLGSDDVADKDWEDFLKNEKLRNEQRRPQAPSEDDKHD